MADAPASAEKRESELLLEVRTEEIPARMLAGAAAELGTRLFEELMARGLAPESIDSAFTPRRLVLILKGLTARERDRSEEVLGPPLKNALDAVESKGARGHVRIHVQRKEDGIEVVVRDNGIGIDPKDLRRVFEPFFTTKEVGRGTGLGLPISARIVERCGGTIRLDSNKDKGTTVVVALPLGAATTPTTRDLLETNR